MCLSIWIRSLGMMIQGVAAKSNSDLKCGGGGGLPDLDGDGVGLSDLVVVTVESWWFW